MKIGLLDLELGPFKGRNGMDRIGAHDLCVADLDTEEPVDNLSGVSWVPGHLLMNSHREGLFSRDHFDSDADYLVLVIPCESAVRARRV